MRLPLLCRAGPIPEGADAVVQVEDTEQLAAAPDGSKRVRISARVAEGHDIRSVVCRPHLDSVFLLRKFWMQRT
jgi:gephyrin